MSVFQRWTNVLVLQLDTRPRLIIAASSDAGPVGCGYAEQCHMDGRGQTDHEQPDQAKNATHRAAAQYALNGWSVIPVPHKSKNPGVSGWQKMRLTSETLGQHFNGSPKNIGVLLGEPSGGLIDVDLDHSLAIELASKYLPPTPAIFGRKSKPRSHWVYRVSTRLATEKFKSQTAGMLLEIRSTGMQTVFPPSTHESGEAIEWETEGAEPAVVDPDELLEAGRRLDNAVKSKLGEKPVSCADLDNEVSKGNNPPESGDNPALKTVQCLKALCRICITDHRDGSYRLFVCACRVVEYDLDDRSALATIRNYALEHPFPRAWSDDEILRRIRDAEKQSRRGQAFEREPNRCVPLGGRDPYSGRLVLSPKRTLPTADAYVREFHLHPDGRTLINYAGVLMEWRGNRYIEVEDQAVKKRLQNWLHGSVRYVAKSKDEPPQLVDFESNSATIKSALESIHAFTHIPGSTVSPSWLSAQPVNLPPHEILPCRTSLLHLPTMRQYAPTPQYFAVNALDFDPDLCARPPEHWHQFMHQLFDGDLESLELLQEWFGYCLTGDTSQQKMLLTVGPKRSGKGTIARVLTHLIGMGNVAGPTTSSLAGPFGLQPLIGKSLAIVSDARFHGENVATVIERLLCISGEDALTIDRKHLTSVMMKLPTRFMFLTNEFPRLSDASGALAGRFVILRLTQSFYGKEDKNLTGRLIGELPGILNWAIEGWQHLRARGHFVMPSSVQDAVQEIEDLSSPVSAFVRDACTIGVGHRVSVDSLYTAWKRWCEQEGRQAISTKQTFGRDLAAAVAGVTRRRGAQPFYEGISLK